MNKKDAIELLNHEGWTKADAKRALNSLDFKLNSNNIDELTIRRAASQFAGAELYERQKLQRGQKIQVTKKTKKFKNILLKLKI